MFNSVSNSVGVGISVLSLGRGMLSPTGANPYKIIDLGERVGVRKFQWIPLRGFTMSNTLESGMGGRIVTIEGPWGNEDVSFIKDPLSRIIFGSTERARMLTLEMITRLPESVISIDFDNQSAVEIAGLPNRDITTGKKMVFDTFHARDYILGREEAMKGALPSHEQVDRIYQMIFDKNPDIVAVQLQERNPRSLNAFVQGDTDNIFQHEIRALLEHVRDRSMPIILELHPFPKGIKTSLLEGTKKSEDFLRRVIAQVNELCY